MSERCMVCNGSGKYAPMGGISVKCIQCEGVGFISLDKSEANRLKMQVNKDSGQNPSGSVQATIPVNVPITPMIADHVKDSVTVSANDIEAIKAKMIADNAMPAPIIDYANMDKRSRAYKDWKANRD